LLHGEKGRTHLLLTIGKSITKKRKGGRGNRKRVEKERKKKMSSSRKISGKEEKWIDESKPQATNTWRGGGGRVFLIRNSMPGGWGGLSHTEIER